MLPLNSPGGSLVKNLPGMQEMHVGDAGSVPGSGRYPGVGNGNPLQRSLAGYSMESDTA